MQWLPTLVDNFFTWTISAFGEHCCTTSWICHNYCRGVSEVHFLRWVANVVQYTQTCLGLPLYFKSTFYPVLSIKYLLKVASILRLLVKNKLSGHTKHLTMLTVYTCLSTSKINPQLLNDIPCMKGRKGCNRFVTRTKAAKHPSQFWTKLLSTVAKMITQHSSKKHVLAQVSAWCMLWKKEKEKSSRELNLAPSNY